VTLDRLVRDPASGGALSATDRLAHESPGQRHSVELHRVHGELSVARLLEHRNGPPRGVGHQLRKTGRSHRHLERVQQEECDAPPAVPGVDEQLVHLAPLQRGDRVHGNTGEAGDLLPGDRDEGAGLPDHPAMSVPSTPRRPHPALPVVVVPAAETEMASRLSAYRASASASSARRTTRASVPFGGRVPAVSRA
jgi:hypothetical protein